MDRSAAVARIKRGLGFRSDQDDNIVLALQEAQRLLERGRTLPYFLLQEDATLSITSGNQDTDLPEGFLREKENETLWFQNDDDEIVKLEKLDLDTARSRFANADPGAPVAYVLRKSTIRVYPEPDVDYSLTWSYYGAAASLESDVENAWLEEELGAPEVLINRAGMLIATDLRDADAYSQFAGRFGEAWTGMFADSEERDHAGRDICMGARL